MDISVIIPTYMPQAYLWECLNSLAAQSLDKIRFEVILVLNGCCEPYKGLIEEYIRRSDMNINFIQTDTGGVSNARNIGLDNALGEYIAFIDDDDYVSPCYLEELLAKASPDTISLCYPYAFDDGNTIQRPYSITDAYTKYAKGGRRRFSYKVRRYFNGPCMKLIPTSFIQNRRFDPRFKNGEDSLFMFSISDKFEYIDFTSPLAKYYRRYRPNSAVTSKKTVSYFCKNTVYLIGAYLTTYFKSPLKYKFTFLVSRILASIKSIFFS